MKEINFHDWLLLKIEIDWVNSSISVLLKNLNSELCYIQAEDFTDIHVPKINEWGESSSIFDIDLSKDKSILKIQMQSGDNLRIIAKMIELI